MNWGQFKDPLFHTYLANIGVPFWSLTQEVAGWKVEPFCCNDKYFLLNSMKTFQKFLPKCKPLLRYHESTFLSTSKDRNTVSWPGVGAISPTFNL